MLMSEILDLTKEEIEEILESVTLEVLNQGGPISLKVGDKKLQINKTTIEILNNRIEFFK